LDNKEAAFIAMQMGSEIGLPIMQSIQSIAVINGRPSLWGDTMLGLVRSSGECEKFHESYEGDGDDFCAVCTTRRKGDTEDTVEKFSIADAKMAKLWGKTGPWTTHPKRMLKYKARNFLLRDVYPDILKGLHMAEVALEEPIDITADVPEASKPAAPEKSSLDKPGAVIDQGKSTKKPKAEEEKKKKAEPEKPAEEKPEPEKKEEDQEKEPEEAEEVVEPEPLPEPGEDDEKPNPLESTDEAQPALNLDSPE
jgi:hypothetical protein